MRALVAIVALLALSAVAFYVVQALPPRIEADLKQRSTEALNAANLTFANVSVTGRVVTLTGEAPGPVAKEEAIKVAGDVWGVSSVHDAIVVSSDGQPVAPQSVIAGTAALPDAAATEPSTSDSSSVLPTIGSLVDPALAPPNEPEPSEPPTATDEPAAPEPTTPAPTPTPPPAAPVETTAVVPPSAPASAPTTVPAKPEPEPAAPAPSQAVAEAPAPTPTPPPPTTTEPVASTPAPTPTPTPAPAQATPQAPAPVQPAPSQTVAAATPPPAPPATRPTPFAKEAIAQGISQGLTAAMQSLPPAVAAAPPAYRLEAHVEGKRVELQGLVSTPSAQRALVAQVRRNIRRAKIVDSLKVAHAKPDKDWLGVARTGLAQLTHLDTGSLKLDGHKVAVSGKPKSERDRARVLAAMSELPSGYTSTVLLERKPDAAPAAPAIAAAPQPAPEPEDVKPAPRPERPQARPPRQAKRPAFVARREVREPPRRHVARGLSSWCRRRFNDVLPRVAVAFASGSWRMEESVGLSDLARVAQQCPDARIRLTGHSDGRETSLSATGLSYRRASTVREALVDRGVAGASIMVVGRGGMHPAFSNATADGRENNRRVEFAVW